MAGDRIYAEVSGEGPPIVFTHGYGDTSATWDAQVAAFSGRATTLRWDLLGHGRSARPRERSAYSREIALEDLEALIGRTEGPAVLVGHSLGGYLSLCRAIRDEGRVRGLVLIATGPGFRDPESRAQWNERARGAAERFDVPEESYGLIEQPDSLVMDALDRVTAPAIVIAGERDRYFHGAMRYLERRLSRAETLIVPGAGHMVHRTHADPVNGAIQSFLSSL
jgi:pimeloyl-ACP methyl ester carboxylesterase